MGKRYLYGFILEELYHVLKVNSQERSACGYGSGRGLLIVIKYTQSLFVLHNKGLLSRKKDYQNPISPEGKVFLPPQTPLAFLSYPRENGELRNTRKCHIPGHRSTKRLRFNYKIIDLPHILPSYQWGSCIITVDYSCRLQTFSEELCLWKAKVKRGDRNKGILEKFESSGT